MPESTLIKKSMYPTNGWSSWFGGYVGTDYPSACPYGIVMRAPGSTGIFAPFNSVHGVKFEVLDNNTNGHARYVSDFQPPVSVAGASISLQTTLPNLVRIIPIYYIEGGAPLFIYTQIVQKSWPNMRAKISFAGPGPPPLPLLSKIGPVVSMTPWNRRGYELLP